MAHAYDLNEANIEAISQAIYYKSIREVRDWLVDAFSKGEKRVIVIFDFDGFRGGPANWENMLESDFYEKYDWIDKTRTNKICMAR